MDERLERNKKNAMAFYDLVCRLADDGREDLSTPARAVRGGNYAFDDAPGRLTGWNRTVNWCNPATGHRQIGVRCAAD